MCKRLLKAIFVAAFFLLLNVDQARAQSATPKYEVGGQISLMRFREILSVDPLLVGNFEPLFPQRKSVTNLGFGGRFIYNISARLAVEGELNFFPDDNDDFVKGGRKAQGVVGIKAGVRKERYGLFAKARPGFVSFGALLDCPQGTPTFEFCTTASRVYPALDLGGVIELYPSSRSVIRFDVGDTLVFTKDRAFFKRVPGDEFESILFPGELKHNPQISVGIGFRF